MPNNAPPLVVNFDLAGLPEGGTEISLRPKPEERAAIARWCGISGLEAFKASVQLSKLGGGYFAYEANFTADVLQACVVTLEPVRSRIAREFRRVFHIAEDMRSAKRSIKISSQDLGDAKEEAEDIAGTVLDVAAPVLEELNLAIDPYPRAPGAAFQAPADEKGGADNPFAVLKKLKTK